MSRPTGLPRWADSGGSITEPTSGKKDVGWLVAEKPAAQFFNWLLNLIYQWLLYWSEYFQAPAAGTYTPIVKWSDPDGFHHATIDHNGFPLGRLITFEETWGGFGTSAVTSTAILSGYLSRWYFATNGGNANIDNNLQDIGPGKTPINIMPVVLEGDLTNGHYVTLETVWEVTHVGQLADSKKWITVLECDCLLGPDNLTSDVDFMVGFTPASNDDWTAETSYIWFRKPFDQTTWYCETSNIGTLTSTDSGVAPPAAVGGFTTFNHFRIEVHGSETPEGVLAGNVATAIFFINDTKVAQNSTNVYSGIASFAFGLKNAAGLSNDAKIAVGNIRIVSNTWSTAATI